MNVHRLWSILPPLALLPFAACSSRSSGSSSDAGTSNTFTCGGGSITGTGRATDPTMGLGPVPGATATAPGCTTAVTDDRGYITVATDPGLMIKLDVTNSGYLHEHAEFALKEAGFQVNGYLYPTSIETTILGGWTDSQGYIAVGITADGSDAGPCSTTDGVTISVKGHPEIKATYLKDQQTADPTLTATSTGFAGGVLGPVPPGTYEADGAKTGCTSVPLDGQYFQYNSSFAVSAGVLTLQSIQLAP
jgi:hypothetical protein